MQSSALRSLFEKNERPGITSINIISAAGPLLAVCFWHCAQRNATSILARDGSLLWHHLDDVAVFEKLGSVKSPHVVELDKQCVSVKSHLALCLLCNLRPLTMECTNELGTNWKIFTTWASNSNVQCRASPEI